MEWIDWCKIDGLIQKICDELDLDLTEVTDVNIWSDGKKMQVDAYLPVKHEKYGQLDSVVRFFSEDQR